MNTGPVVTRVGRHSEWWVSTAILAARQHSPYVDVGLKTDFILSFNAVLVFSLLYVGLLIMDDDEPDRMMMIMLTS